MSTEHDHGQDDQPGGGREPLDLGDEMGRLADAVQGWWTAQRPSPARPVHSGSADGATGENSCRGCPLCRAADLVRGIQPELLDHLAVAAETVAVLLRDAAEGRRQAGSGDDGVATDDTGASDDQAPDEQAEPFRRGTRIVVDDGDGSHASGEHQGGRSAWG